MKLADTHAHLDGPEFAADLNAVLKRATTAGVRAIVSAGQDEATSRATLALAHAHNDIAAAVGVHPHEAKGAGDMRWLEPMFDDPRVVAAGEMGLDYHYDNSPHDVQRDVLAHQLDLAAKRDLPVILHCREAEDDLVSVLRGHFARGRL
ncbi:MAG: TatD family hydrolase, partial [Candidatus Eremiobacteraeota bacterium]|nr:TatD family hydrolase [Candidatus Eremiobacteraeota bacterium]